jgi:transketolase
MKDKKIYLLLGDLGYGVFDKHRKKYPDRVINCGASEQAMMDIAVGLAYEGKIPVVYSITPFLLYRPFETIRTYIDNENLPVKLIGSGRDKDYKHDGISHWSEDDRSFMYEFLNIHCYWPERKETINEQFLRKILYNAQPVYVNLKR